MLAFLPSFLNSLIFNINGKFSVFRIEKATEDMRLQFTHNLPSLAGHPTLYLISLGQGVCCQQVLWRRFPVEIEAEVK